MNTKSNKPLKIGDKVPSFSLLDQNGTTFNSSDIIGKQPAVIYFYPKDDTPGCTKEACKFRDEFEIFTDLNAKVIGISSDDVASHKNFAEKYHLPFTLLADTDKKVRQLFGVQKSTMGLLPGRVTYVVNAKGFIIYIFEKQFGAEKHISEAIKALKSS
ncbi:MAG: peroxiredoxin [Flavobacteriaceae bacterium]|nr:peroxiredoxin [Flavobacteriaceae bacterium]